MALSGTFTGTSANAAIVPKIVWSGVQSHSGKYTDVTATLYYSRTDASKTSGTWVGTITINGVTSQASKYITITYNSNTMAITATTRVPHNDDGTKSITISATGAISGTTLKSTTISATVELDTIPIPSTISVSNVIIGSPATISIASASANFTHTLRYSFGSITEQVIAATTNKTSIIWTVPTAFYNEIPNSPTGWGVITCVTYNGYNKVGETVYEFTAVADKTICAPQIRSVNAYDPDPKSVILTGDNKKIILNAGPMKVQTNAVAVNGASIESIKVYNGTNWLAGADVTFPYAYMETVYVIVTDTRGYTTRYDVTDLTFISYYQPTMSYEITRESPTSDKVTVSVNGIWHNISFGKTSNQLSLSVCYKIEGAAGYGATVAMPVFIDGYKFSSTFTFSGMNYTNAYRFTMYLSDKVFSDGSVYPTKVFSDIPLSKGIPVFDWGEDDFRFNVPVTFAAGYIDPTSVASVEPADFILEQGTSGMWTYRKWNSGIAEAWGEATITSAIQTGYGNGFYNGSVYSLDLPYGLFKIRPQVVTSVFDTSDAQLYFVALSVTKSATLHYSIVSTKSNPAASVVVSFRATGRWKD